MTIEPKHDDEILTEHPMGRRLLAHVLESHPPGRWRTVTRAYLAMPKEWWTTLEREISHVIAASGRDFETCLDDLSAFNTLSHDTGNDEWYEQPRAFTSMHLDVAIPGFSRRRLEQLRDLVVRHAAAARRVLEVGSGSGWLAGQLADRMPTWSMTLLDRSPAAVRFAQAYHALRGTGDRTVCRRGEQAGIHAPDDAFDLVIAAEVLEHAPNPEGSVREMLRVLRPGGWIVLSVPLDLAIAMHPVVFGGVEEIEGLLRGSGVDILASEVARPDPTIDSICDVFPGFAGCLNLVGAKR